MKQPAELRPRQHLLAAGQRYPGAWKMAESFCANRGKDGLDDWPEWCLLPMAAWYAIISGGRNKRLDLTQVADVSIMASLGAWRMGQGVYRFDPTLYAGLIDTTIDGNVPNDLLLRLPEWGVYIETPGLSWMQSTLHGVFAHLEYDVNNQDVELVLLLDTEDGLTSIPVHLGPWSLNMSIAKFLEGAQPYMSKLGISVSQAEIEEFVKETVQPLMSLLLFLCSSAADYQGGRSPSKPVPVLTRRHGVKTFAATAPTVWETGARIGAALRRAYHARETAKGGTHAGPIPHIRKAHWHGFRMGPKKTPDGVVILTVDRPLDVRWMTPIAVNMTGYDDLSVTIHPVKP